MPFGEFLTRGSGRAIASSTTFSTRAATFRSASRCASFSGWRSPILQKTSPPTRTESWPSCATSSIYEPGMTNVQSTADEILNVGGGVCQDFAHLTIGVLRLAGIPPATSPAIWLPPPTGDGVGRRASQSRLARSSAAAAGMDRLRSNQRMHASTSATSESLSAATTPTYHLCAAYIGVTAANR